MDKNVLNLSAFEKALKSLEEIIIRYQKEKDDTAIRDALIQRFEYTYSLAIKMIKRYLKIYLTENEEVDTMDFNRTIREASRIGILFNNLEIWTVYRQKRNITSHTDDEKKALEVVEIVNDFFEDAKYLLNKLQERI